MKPKLLEPKQIKFNFTCEICCNEAYQLFVIENFLYCKECADAYRIRERFLREEKEWETI